MKKEKNITGTKKEKQMKATSIKMTGGIVGKDFLIQADSYRVLVNDLGRVKDGLTLDACKGGYIVANIDVTGTRAELDAIIIKAQELKNWTVMMCPERLRK